MQRQGLDTVEANLRLGYKVDERNYDDAVMILKKLKVESIYLITNNPRRLQVWKHMELRFLKLLVFLRM